MKMFTDIATKIFQKAGVNPDLNPELFAQCQSILSSRMASLSSSLGLDITRKELFDNQKQSLVDDLIALKDAGETQ